MAGRNSDIERAGMGLSVMRHNACGQIPSEIAMEVSKESGHLISAASVRRHLAKQSVNAAVTDEYQAAKMVAAAISGLADTRDTDTSSYLGKYALNTTNNFTRYYGLARGIKNGQVLRAFKNIALKITNGARIIGDERDADKIAALSTAINFSSLLQNTVRYTCEMGTCIIGTKTDDTYIQPSILPMQYYTLLTDSETAGTVDADKLVHGVVTKIVFDETGDNKKIFEREDIGLLRIWEDGNEIKDIAGRNTFGIYGESMTNGVETPLKSLLNSSYYYDEFIKRYGMGRLNINLKLISDLLVAGKITDADAQAAQDAITAAMQKLSANEDMVGMGNEVSMLETKTGFNIMPFLEWRAKQIDRALLQSDVGAGNVGSSWTSSGTAVSAQDYDTYNSLRGTLFEQFMAEIILPRCEEFTLKSETLSIAATPFLRVDVPFPDLIEMHDRGIITEAELRDRGGFSAVKPDEE